MRDTEPSCGCSISSAEPVDSEGILACLAAAFAPYRESYTPAAFTDTVLTLESLNERLHEMSVLVAKTASGEVVGTIACHALEQGEGHLRGMAVLPDWQGTGVGDQLLGAAEEELRRDGCSSVTLDTTEPLKRAIHFYERNGYRATGNIQDFFGMALFEYRKSLRS